ncbi:MAG: hypothetical protein WBE34_03330 [Candidatus Nitrosopolaris sp.]
MGGGIGGKLAGGGTGTLQSELSVPIPQPIGGGGKLQTKLSVPQPGLFE